MNWNRIEGNWKQFQGRVRQQWGKLTDDDLEVIGGDREELAGRIQEIYGITQDEAEEQIERFAESLKDEDKAFGDQPATSRRTDMETSPH